MMDERTLYLINAEIDGALEPAEQAELEHILETSAQAREVRVEFQRLSNLLDSQPANRPPAGLKQQILDQISLPSEKESFSWGRLVESIQPATAGMAFAAGLLATVAFYELTSQPGTTTDTASMVGTMVAGQNGRQLQAIDSLAIREAGLDGRVSLHRENQVYVLSFELDSRDKVEVEISYAEAGLSFGGLAHTLSGDRPENESYVISGGILRVDNKGRQAFSVFLPQAASSNGGGRAIDIAIYSGGAQRFSGVIQG